MAAGMLGDGDYTIRFVRRRTLLGPPSVIGALPATSGAWNRLINGTSDASAVFALGEPECVDVLNLLDPWRSEMEVWRDPGDLCWVGPVLDVVADEASDQATVTAKDLSAWWSVRGVFQTLVHRQVDLAAIFAEYVAVAFALDDPGVTVVTTPVGVLGDRTVAEADLKMLTDLLPDLVSAGVDWTVTNRVFWVGGSEISPAGRIPGRLVDEHFTAAPQTHLSGAGMVNDARVRGNNVSGQHGGADVDGVLIQGVQDQSSTPDQASADWAAETWWDRVHDPLVYLDGSNALTPLAPVGIEELIPGLLQMVDVNGGGVVPVRQLLRLEKVDVEFAADSETVTVTHQPPGTTDATAATASVGL